MDSAETILSSNKKLQAQLCDDLPVSRDRRISEIRQVIHRQGKIPRSSWTWCRQGYWEILENVINIRLDVLQICKELIQAGITHGNVRKIEKNCNYYGILLI